MKRKPGMMSVRRRDEEQQRGGRVALVLIDVINHLEFDDGPQLLKAALPVARRIAALKARAVEAALPIIYANDNFGRWRSDFREVIAHCMRDGSPSRPLVETLLPDESDYFVLKPRHSGFFCNTMDLLLEHLGVRALILAGITGDICVLFTAMDAYMRDYRLTVPSDCVASVDAEENRKALAYMERVLKADIRPSAEVEV